jgi:hypothetical protein
MSPPATGEKTPKRKRNDAELALLSVTPHNSGEQEQALRALIAAFTAAATTAAGPTTASNTPSSRTTSSSPSREPEIPFDYELDPEDEEAIVEKPLVIPACSLKSLPTAFHTFAESISKKVQALLMQKRAKTKVSEKLRSRSFIPASLKSDFELTSSKEVRGSTEFFHLAAAATTAMTTCVEEIKGYMADVADMENAILDTKIHELLIVALDGFSRLLLINSLNRTERLPIREFTLSTLSKYIQYFTTPANYGLASDVALFSKYKEVMADPNSLWTSDRATTEFESTHSTSMATLVSLINETFIVRWQNKVKEMQAKETATLLDTAQKKILTETACADTAKALAQETTMDDSQMTKVIAEKLAQTTKELSSKVGRLENIVNRTKSSAATPPSSNAKKAPGGAAPGRASKDKKTNPRKAIPNQRKPNAPAAASDNDSSAAKKAKQRTKSKKSKPGNSRSKPASSKNTRKSS